MLRDDESGGFGILSAQLRSAHPALCGRHRRAVTSVAESGIPRITLDARRALSLSNRVPQSTYSNLGSDSFWDSPLIVLPDRLHVYVQSHVLSRSNVDRTGI